MGGSDFNESRGRGRGSSRPTGICYNCNEPGHMSKDCTQERKQSYGRGRGRGGDRNNDREE